jgi:hypothetical protein
VRLVKMAGVFAMRQNRLLQLLSLCHDASYVKMIG